MQSPYPNLYGLLHRPHPNLYGLLHRPIQIYTVCCTALSESIRFVAPPYPNLSGFDDF